MVMVLSIICYSKVWKNAKGAFFHPYKEKMAFSLHCENVHEKPSGKNCFEKKKVLSPLFIQVCDKTLDKFCQSQVSIKVRYTAIQYIKLRMDTSGIHFSLFQNSFMAPKN